MKHFHPNPCDSYKRQLVLTYTVSLYTSLHIGNFLKHKISEKEISKPVLHLLVHLTIIFSEKLDLDKTDLVQLSNGLFLLTLIGLCLCCRRRQQCTAVLPQCIL